MDGPGRATHSGVARRWQSAALLLLLACVRPMPAQEPPKPPPQPQETAKAVDAPKPSEPPKPAPNDPVAVGVLEKAAAAQMPGYVAPVVAAPVPGAPVVAPPPPPPLALHAKVSLRYQRDGAEVAVEAERRFLAPDRIWTRAVSKYDGAETITGYDGARPWLWSRKRGLAWLDEPGLEEDLKQLRLDVELTELLAGAFQLSRLIPRLSGVARLPDVVRDGVASWVVAGDLDVTRGGATKRARVELQLDPDKLHLVGARVVVAGEAPLQVWFSKHHLIDGLDVPAKIALHVGDAKEPEQSLLVQLLSVAPKLADADFAPPK